MEKYEELMRITSGLDKDMAKFYEKGNKAAGVRVRQSMQDVKRLAQEIREEIAILRKQ